MPAKAPSNPPTELDYQLLQQLDEEPAASQRHLAARLGVSVGKVNFCLRALVDKGWVKAQNFHRSDNKRAYAYLLTPRGMGAKVQLTRDFLARKEHEYELLAREIHALRGALTRETADARSHDTIIPGSRPPSHPSDRPKPHRSTP